MTELSLGDEVEVTTGTINDGEPFAATVLSVDESTFTATVEPHSLDVVEMAVVGKGEITETINTNRN